MASREIVLKTNTYPYPLPAEIGDLFLRAEIFSQGNDFTNSACKQEGYDGISLMKRIWGGEDVFYLRQMKEAVITTVWHDGVLQGAFLWLKPFEGEDVVVTPVLDVPKQSNYNSKFQIPTSNLGAMMTFLKAPYRGHGIIKAVVKDEIMPRIEPLLKKSNQIGAFPIVSASDACNELLSKTNTLPLSSVFNTSSQKFRSDVWRFWNLKDLCRSEGMPWQNLLIKPESLSKPKRNLTQSVPRAPSAMI